MPVEKIQTTETTQAAFSLLLDTRQGVMIMNQRQQLYKNYKEGKYHFNQDYIRDDYKVKQAASIDDLVNAVQIATLNFISYQFYVVKEYYQGTKTYEEVIETLGRQKEVLQRFLADYKEITGNDIDKTPYLDMMGIRVDKV